MDSHNISQREHEINEHNTAYNIFENLKSDYFLQKLFENLPKKKSLEILKYNKKIKNRLNINLNNYKEFSEIYSLIELELIPVENQYGKFIDNYKKEDYIHIYFNDNKEEIKRNYLEKNEKVAKIKILIDYQIRSFEYLFE